MSAEDITAYRRPCGRVGVRNHVVILPLDDLSNAASEAVAGSFRAPWLCRMLTVACSLALIWSCSFAP